MSTSKIAAPIESDWRNGNRQNSVIEGKTIVKIVGVEVGSEEIVFTFDDGTKFRFWYEHDCCASCAIAEIVGDVTDLLNTPLLVAEERDSGHSSPDGWSPSEYEESYTWTFYTFRTIKGTVDVRWFGSSNGYYSESVSCEWVTADV